MVEQARLAIEAIELLMTFLCLLGLLLVWGELRRLGRQMLFRKGGDEGLTLRNWYKKPLGEIKEDSTGRKP